MKLKSPTTINTASDKIRVRRGGPRVRRLPSQRPPTHPGEMLMEEFLRPLGITQVAFARRLGVSFPRLNEIVKGRRGVTPGAVGAPEDRKTKPKTGESPSVKDAEKKVKSGDAKTPHTY